MVINNEIYKYPSVRGLIKSARLRWLGHMAQMSEAEILPKVLLENSDVQRECEQLKTRWLDTVKDGLFSR